MIVKDVGNVQARGCDTNIKHGVGMHGHWKNIWKKITRNINIEAWSPNAWTNMHKRNNHLTVIVWRHHRGVGGNTERMSGRRRTAGGSLLSILRWIRRKWNRRCKHTFFISEGSPIGGGYCKTIRGGVEIEWSIKNSILLRNKMKGRSRVRPQTDAIQICSTR